MATQGDLAAAQNPAATALMQALFGGKQETTNPGNIAPLENVLAQLQRQDFNALLQSIFQQAAGQIPGLQAAYGNAIGARSGGNSAVQAALNELLKQTTLAGQQQVVQQQNQNLQTQQQAAANIAEATRGTKTETGGDLGSIATNLLLLQGLSALTGKDGLLSGAMDKLGGLGKSVADGFTSPTATSATGAPQGLGISTGNAVGLSAGGGQGMQFGGAGGGMDVPFTGYEAPSYDLGAAYTDMYGPSLGLQAGYTDMGNVGYQDFTGFDYSLAGATGGGMGFNYAPEDFFQDTYSW